MNANRKTTNTESAADNRRAIPWNAMHPCARWYVDGDGVSVRFRIENGAGDSTDGYVLTVDAAREEFGPLNRAIAARIVAEHVATPATAFFREADVVDAPRAE
jgi:hypothetical protein